MRYYPVFLDIKNKPCVVVGGGKVAERKVLQLLSSGAVVTVISPTLTIGLSKLKNEKKINHTRRGYRAGDLAGAQLVVAASGAKSANRAAFDEATSLGVQVNTVDDPERCSFIVPSVINRGGLTIAISTAGKAPAMAKALRRELEKSVGPEYAVAVEIIGAVRKHLLKKGADRDKKERVINTLASSDIPRLVSENSRAGINGLLAGLLGEGFTLSKLGIKLPSKGSSMRGVKKN